MFDFSAAYTNFKKLTPAEKSKKLLFILEQLASALPTYNDMLISINNTPDIEDQTLINYYEILLNDFIKLEEINTQKEYKDTFKKLLIGVTSQKDEETDHDSADILLETI